jgi:N,N'-diacetyllegionaminate synthase
MENKIKNFEIIAELAQGFEGSSIIAKKLIRSAKLSNADAIKLQSVYSDELSIPGYEYHNFFKKLELNKKDWKQISNCAKKNKIKLYFDIFGKLSLKLAESLNIDGIKIHPTDLNNFELINQIRKSKIKKIFLGIGGATLDEIKKIVNILKKKKLILLLGFQGYPTKSEDNNLFRITLLKKFFGKKKFIQYGFAEHDINKNIYQNNASMVAIGAGATYLEKHFTIKHGNKPLEDSESALYPNEFKEYVEIMKNSYSCYSTATNPNNFIINNKEIKYKNNISRSLVAKFRIKKGTKLTKKMFDFKRVAEKDSIKNFSAIKNKIIKSSLEKNKPLRKKFI